MKKFKLQAIALLVVVSLAFTSCSNDDNPGPNVVLKEALVTVVTGPQKLI
ncbi:hypothetical protein [Flavobacterium soli]|nr:hypothetical protein [Flavobacterium soli]